MIGTESDVFLLTKPAGSNSIQRACSQASHSKAIVSQNKVNWTIKSPFFVDHRLVYPRLSPFSGLDSFVDNVPNIHILFDLFISSTRILQNTDNRISCFLKTALFVSLVKLKGTNVTKVRNFLQTTCAVYNQKQSYYYKKRKKISKFYIIK